MLASQSLQIIGTQTLQEELQGDLDTTPCEQEIRQKALETVGQLLQMGEQGETGVGDARNALENMSQKLQLQAARKSELLKAPIQQLYQRSEDGGPVAKALIDLKMQVEALDPARYDFSPGWFSRLLGFLPFIGTPLKRYFARYESSSSLISSIVASLEAGREQLKRDNITLQADQADMRELSRKLARACKLGQLMDAELVAKLEQEIPKDDAKYRFVQEELLFPLRQRIQDLQQQLAVNQQGVLTTELIVRNNRELIRGVNRATQVTVNALQIAVTLALALANQKIVLSKIAAVNQATDSLIANNAAQLRQQGVEIHKQAASAQLSIETLKTAFEDIGAALDDISRFRQEALPTMGKNIEQLEQLTRTTEATIQRMESARPVMHPALEIEATD